MRGVVVVFVVLAAIAGTAIAQPGNTPPGAPAAPTYAPPPPPPATGPVPGEKSPGAALVLSLGGTVASYVLIVAAEESQSSGDGLATIGALGMFLAPTFGHWYAGKVWTDGLTLRLAGLGGMMVGLILLLDECGFEGDSSCDEGAGTVVMVLGAGAYVGGTILDIATAPGQARKYNARLRERAASGWAVAPTVTRNGAGLVLGGRF